MSYQVYRNTTLGTTLQDSLDELLANQQISRSLKDKVLEEVCVPCIFMVFMSLQNCLSVFMSRSIKNVTFVQINHMAHSYVTFSLIYMFHIQSFFNFASLITQYIPDWLVFYKFVIFVSCMFVAMVAWGNYQAGNDRNK